MFHVKHEKENPDSLVCEEGKAGGQAIPAPRRLSPFRALALRFDSEAMKLFRSGASAKGLVSSDTSYVARMPQRRMLRFSKSGNPTIEQLYRTHWISGELSERKRERLAEKARRAPELVVIQPLDDAWTCHRCGSTGGLLVMENPGPACLRCVGLDDLEFLSAGDALLQIGSSNKEPSRWRN